MSGDGDWQEVRRRRPYPANWRRSQPSPPTAQPYQPYSRPSYAQVLLQNLQNTTMNSAVQISPKSTQPSSPATSPTTVYYVSPHSPSRLRFPPSHTFAEWKGRCFRCCRTGHSAAKCRNPKRCGKCWSYGHIGSKCKQEVVPPPPPFRPAPKPKPKLQFEPDFEELLVDSYPCQSPEMPAERPLRLHCFIERDEWYYAEMERLKQAVVMHTKGYQGDLSVHNVVSYACRTNKVKKEEIQVSELSGSRFLIKLPEGLDPDTFINATPQEAWNEGITFQPWSPLEEAEISIPAYKVLLRLVGVPPHLWRTKYVAQAVCRFGVFLGSVTPENSSSVASWIVAVGVDDLTLVPPSLAMHVGGMIHNVQVYTMAWKRAPIYSADDMPKHPKVYQRPQPLPPSSSSSDDDTDVTNTELIPMSAKVLRDLCRGKRADSLPPELRKFATVEETDMQYPCMATREPDTRDQVAQNQKSPENLHPVSQRPQVQLDGKPMKKDVADRSVHILTQHETIPMSFHKGSDDIRAVETELPKGTNFPSCDSATRSSSPINHVDQMSQDFPLIQLPRLNTRIPQPQKILQRGSSSGNKSPIAPIKGKGTGSVTNHRAPLSHCDMPFKKDVTITGGDNPKSAATINRGVITETFPTISASSQTRHLSTAQTQNQQMIFQAQPKGPYGPAISGPYARNYKWKRPTAPVNNAQITKRIIASAGSKRKNNALPPLGSAKKTTAKGKGKEIAEVNFNSEGFFEVQVQYEHVSNLAAGCGFKNTDVEKIIQDDNDQRQAQAVQQASLPIVPHSALDEEDPDLARFELDSSDELSSDEEAA